MFGLLLSMMVSALAVRSEFRVEPKCLGCRIYECYERLLHCGPMGYFEAYGSKYCRRFNDSEVLSRFSTVGKQFLSCTTECLISFLDKYLKETDIISCEQLEAAAFRSHIQCYLNCDFCSVCKTQKLPLLRSYDIWDFASIIALQQVTYAIISFSFFTNIVENSYCSRINSDVTDKFDL
ncbi:hypothetical protein AB6A40_009048 [Gnathostoma spinigerum]|uniref:Uncharacterized protein n=1 Tax=Gnathostoma spinigerum TaxID=75299 RepID=A0ABD6EYL4_9BILA